MLVLGRARVPQHLRCVCINDVDLADSSISDPHAMRAVAPTKEHLCSSKCAGNLWGIVLVNAHQDVIRMAIRLIVSARRAIKIAIAVGERMISHRSRSTQNKTDSPIRPQRKTMIMVAPLFGSMSCSFELGRFLGCFRQGQNLSQKPGSS